MEGLREIIKVIKPKLDASKIEESANLVVDLGVDSLSMMLLSLAVENKFQFQFDTVEPFKTVGEVIDYIEKATN